MLFHVTAEDHIRVMNEHEPADRNPRGSSIRIMTSTGSPSSAKVHGTKPKSKGKLNPSASRPPSVKA
jgi:hypothetical protein